jgi:thiol-disulfide isomerase/thioredoxin
LITLGKKRRKKSNRSSSLTSLLIVSGIVILIVAVAMLKNGSATEEGVADTVLPETQLAQAIAAQKPTLAFYHSNTCDTCIQMVETVALVYPEFSGGVELVDVDVYDERNMPLLRQARISYIPTLVFYDGSGASDVVIGMMTPDALRERLGSLAGQ